MITSTPKGSRLHLAIFGKRNVGKSSFLNAFVDQELSIVSEIPGTTTDPIEKAYELIPVGPVLLIDTAGLDDSGTLGEKRVQKTRQVLKRADFAFLVVERETFGDFEYQIIESFKEKNLPWMIIVNKKDIDNKSKHTEFISQLKKQFSVPIFGCSSETKEGIEEIRKKLISDLEKIAPPPPILSDLVSSSDLVVLVIPVDEEMPKGRLILPEVQTMRELLDANVPYITVKDQSLSHVLKNILKVKPKLVVTDSQAFEKVNAEVPDNILLTSFSILFGRQKGNLAAYVKGAQIIDHLQEGDKILIAELCSHHIVCEDIGRVKIPRWIKQHKGININFEIAAGKDWPSDLTKYKLIIQCGACVVNRQLVLSRIKDAKNQGVAITNYGVAIAFLHGILERALKPFND